MLTGTSGLLLFACMFMPAVEGCNQPVVPLDMPPFWAPYLYGLVFAFAALVRTGRGLVGATWALRALAVLVTLAGFAFAFVAPPIGIFLICFGSILVTTIGWHGVSERRLAATAIVVAATSSLWFLLWTMTPAALLGVKLSLGSALGMFAGSVQWLADTRWPARPPRVPPAIVHWL